MWRCSLWIPLLVNVLFSYSIGRSINVNVHRSYALGVIGAEDTKTIDVGLGIDSPLSTYIGFHAGICGLGSGGDVYKPVIAGEVGLIELYSTEYISPYAVQYLQPGIYDKDDGLSVNYFFNIGIGVEFFSKYPVKPFVEAGFSMGIDHLAERFGGGMRFSF
jgi:hypothetical protein